MVRIRSSARGFSLIELVVASGVMLLLVAVAMQTLAPSDRIFEGQAEVADMQQRARAGLAALHRDLADASGGGAVGADGAALITYAPAIWPHRVGLRAPDAPGTFRTDAVTVVSALPFPAVQTATMVPTAAAAGATRVASGAGCPALDPVCGLAEDVDVLVADREGAVDFFTVSAVTPPMVSLRHNGVDWAKVYPIGSPLLPVSVRTYYLRPASGARPPQLVRYEGGSGPDAAVVDHVVALRFDYFGDPDPPRMRRPLSDPVGPWTTYGPRPPVDNASVTPFIAGSNCVFANSGTPIAAPLLPSLGAPDSALVLLTPAQLTDGPWCPDATAPNRYDADLLRIRSIAMTLRIESALAALRGPAGLLFTRGGTARSGDRYAPDFEIRTRITPRNLVLGR